MGVMPIAFWLVYAGGICAAIFNPIIGVALYILVYHLNPETQWWGSSVSAVGLRTSFTVALATGIGVLIRRPTLEAGVKQFPLPMVLAILFALCVIGSMAWGLDTTRLGMLRAEKLVKLLIFLFIMLRCVRTPAQYHIVVTAWLVGVAYLGYQASGNVGISLGGRLTAGIGGPDFAESSGLATHLAASIPLIGAMFFMARTWFGRLFMLATGALAVNTLVLTRTRSAIVGLGLAGCACVMALPRGYRLRGFAAVIVGSILALQLADGKWWDRIVTVFEYRLDASASQRLVLWQAALCIARDYPFGIGVGNFHDLVRDYVPGLDYDRSAHNTFMTCLAEMGWVGLLLFSSMLFVILRRLGTVRRIAQAHDPGIPVAVGRWTTNFHLDWHAVGIRAALMGYLGCAMFTSRLTSEDLWLLVGLAMCLHNVASAMAARETQPASEDGPLVAPAALDIPAGHPNASWNPAAPLGLGREHP